MYVAFAAGLNSACLSRQAGAAIADERGNILSTGTNDVPKAGGGLYTANDGEDDHRCFNRQGGICCNDQEKDLLSKQIEEIVRGLEFSQKDAFKVADAIRNQSRVSDLIEFSRFFPQIAALRDFFEFEFPMRQTFCLDHTGLYGVLLSLRSKYPIRRRTAADDCPSPQHPPTPISSWQKRAAPTNVLPLDSDVPVSKSSDSCAAGDRKSVLQNPTAVPELGVRSAQSMAGPARTIIRAAGDSAAE